MQHKSISSIDPSIHFSIHSSIIMRRPLRTLLFMAVSFLAFSAVFVGLVQNPHLEDDSELVPGLRPTSRHAVLGEASIGKENRAALDKFLGQRKLGMEIGKGVGDFARVFQPPLVQPPASLDHHAMEFAGGDSVKIGPVARTPAPSHGLGVQVDGDAPVSQGVPRSPLPAIPGGAPSYLQTPNYQRIWPTRHEDKDRIVNQMNVVPRGHSAGDPKMILVYNGLPQGTPPGDKKFIKDECPVTNCILTDDRKNQDTADAVLFQNGIHTYPNPRPEGQIWIIFILESPLHIRSFDAVQSMVNWTATYRLDSTINTPYERFVPFANATKRPEAATRNYAEGKRYKVAWFVSNCGASNGRLAYARELSKHISVHMYGACGDRQCSRTDTKGCFDMLKEDYKFYLAFENSNCIDYITEKFYWNALNNDVLPIAMGARPEDYRKVAPSNSFIHVDDFESPRHLAEYLHKLDQDDALYNEYFRWKGTGEFINTKFWCRLCSLIHQASDPGAHAPVMWYDNLQKWWNGPRVCMSEQALSMDDLRTWSSWRNVTRDDLIHADDTLQFG